MIDKECLTLDQLVPRPCVHERNGEPPHTTLRAWYECVTENGVPHFEGGLLDPALMRSPKPRRPFGRPNLGGPFPCLLAPSDGLSFANKWGLHDHLRRGHAGLSVRAVSLVAEAGRRAADGWVPVIPDRLRVSLAREGVRLVA